MKTLSCYSRFSEAEPHSIVPEEPKVPGCKGRSSSERFPTPLMGNMELQKNLWAHIFLVDVGLHNVLWFGAWAKCLNQLF